MLRRAAQRNYNDLAKFLMLPNIQDWLTWGAPNIGLLSLFELIYTISKSSMVIDDKGRLYRQNNT